MPWSASSLLAASAACQAVVTLFAVWFNSSPPKGHCSVWRCRRDSHGTEGVELEQQVGGTQVRFSKGAHKVPVAGPLALLGGGAESFGGGPIPSPTWVPVSGARLSRDCVLGNSAAESS